MNSFSLYMPHILSHSSIPQNIFFENRILLCNFFALYQSRIVSLLGSVLLHILDLS